MSVTSVWCHRSSSHCVSCHSSRSNNNNNRLCICLHHGLLQQWHLWCLNLSLSFPNFVPPLNFTQNNGRKFQVTSQTSLDCHNTAFVCTESRLRVNCSMVRNWKVCQPEHKEHESTPTPLAPQPFQFSTKQLSSYSGMHNLELAETIEPDIRTFVCLFVCVFFVLGKWNCQFFYILLWMIAILAAAWEIPATKDITMESENSTTQWRKSVISSKLRWQLIKGLLWWLLELPGACCTSVAWWVGVKGLLLLLLLQGLVSFVSFRNQIRLG
jgi:hypothetical protein